MALSRLVTLTISSLLNLDIEANKFYDRTHRLQFVNKGNEFIDLPCIFKDKSVISPIPTCFENKESPIICYKYNKPIRSTVFNYNKLVTELDIENSIPDS